MWNTPPVQREQHMHLKELLYAQCRDYQKQHFNHNEEQGKAARTSNASNTALNRQLLPEHPNTFWTGS